MEKFEKVSHWQNVLGVTYGMSKEEALEKFREWRERKKTCQRCEGESLVEFCPIRLICMEAENVRNNAERDDNRSGTFKTPELEAVRTSIVEGRKRASIR